MLFLRIVNDFLTGLANSKRMIILHYEASGRWVRFSRDIFIRLDKVYLVEIMYLEK